MKYTTVCVQKKKTEKHTAVVVETFSLVIERFGDPDYLPTMG